MLTKTILYTRGDGACALVEVAFNWQHGDPLPGDALAQYFPNVADAMSELAGRGRLAARIHVPQPESKKTAKTSAEHTSALTNDGDTA